MSASPNLQLPYIDANQNQKSVTHNQALRMLDALVNLGVQASTLKAPPAAPGDGQRWIVASGGTGAWTGKDLNLAAWQDGAWCFYPPGPGMLAYDLGQATLLFWSGTAWRPIASLLALLAVTALGIGTAADPANPLSATLNNALFNALGTAAGGTGDVRVKLNKAAPGNTASFLFQDGFSGRAEIGLVGDDGFHFKVSPDGSTFVDALVLAAANGGASFAVSPTAPTPPAGDASTRLATTAFVASAVAALVAAAPGALDTLKELADALGDDPNFAATMTAALAARAPLASPALTGAPTAPTPALGDASTRLATTAFVAGATDPLLLSPVGPTLDYRLTASDCLPPGQFSRLSSGYRTNSAGLLVPVAAGGLRVDHDPVTGACLGALVEEQRTNLLLSSQAFDNAAWGKSVVAVSADAITAPDGTLTADRLTSAGADGYASQAVALPAGPFTLSIWCKSPDAGRSVNLVVQVGSTRLISSRQAVSSSWQRFVASGSNATAQSVSINLGGDTTLPNGAIIDLWGAQIEAGAFPTSYVATTAAQATRAPDTLVVPVTSDWFNTAEGTFYVEATGSPSDIVRTLFEAGTPAGQNRIMLRNDAGHYQGWVSQNGNSYVGVGGGPAAPGQVLRAALAYNASVLTLAMNGTLPAAPSPTGGGLPTPQTLLIGASLYDRSWCAPIRRIAYLPRALSPAQLQAMTS